MVEESLVADADVGCEAGLRLLFRAQWWQVAGRGIGEAGEAAGEIEELSGS